MYATKHVLFTVQTKNMQTKKNTKKIWKLIHTQCKIHPPSIIWALLSAPRWHHYNLMYQFFDEASLIPWEDCHFSAPGATDDSQATKVHMKQSEDKI